MHCANKPVSVSQTHYRTCIHTHTNTYAIRQFLTVNVCEHLNWFKLALRSRHSSIVRFQITFRGRSNDWMSPCEVKFCTTPLWFCIVRMRTWSLFEWRGHLSNSGLVDASIALTPYNVCQCVDMYEPCICLRVMQHLIKTLKFRLRLN